MATEDKGARNSPYYLVHSSVKKVFLKINVGRSSALETSIIFKSEHTENQKLCALSIKGFFYFLCQKFTALRVHTQIFCTFPQSILMLQHENLNPEITTIGSVLCPSYDEGGINEILKL